MPDDTPDIPDDVAIWRYDGGEWSRTSEPFDWNPEDPSDVEAALQRAGYRKATVLGPKLLPVVEIYEHDEGESWVLACCFDGSNVHNIHVPNLPSLLDLFGKLAPYVTASTVSDISARLDKLITLTEFESDKEFRRRTSDAPF